MNENKTLYEQLKQVIYTYGRKIEIKLFEFLYEETDKEDVIQALASYQNEDGGFGHGLEPDFINPNSSPIQTWCAMQIMRQLDLPSDHTMIVKMFSYLENTYQKDLKRWLNTIESNDQYPRAPWWNYQDRKLQTSFNPSIAIAGFILTHADMSQDIYQIAREVIYDGIMFIELAEKPIEVHEMSCFMELANDLIHLGGESMISDKLKNTYKKQIDWLINLDETLWFTSYAVKPSSLIHNHPSFLSNFYENLLQKEIDLSLDYLDTDGSWPITWSWNQYDDEFIDASRSWKAIMALNYLKLFKKFGYV